MNGLVYEEMVEKRFIGYGGLLVLFVSFGVYLHTLTPTVGLHNLRGDDYLCLDIGDCPSTWLSIIYLVWQAMDDYYTNWKYCL